MKNKLKLYRKNLKEAQSKGWWIACLYWEHKIEGILNVDR